MLTRSRVRRAQGLLKELLGPGYAGLRPRDRANMRLRVPQLRECRALAHRRRQALKTQITHRQGEGSTTSPSATRSAAVGGFLPRTKHTDENRLELAPAAVMAANSPASPSSANRSRVMLYISLDQMAVPDQKIIAVQSTTEPNRGWHRFLSKFGR